MKPINDLYIIVQIQNKSDVIYLYTYIITDLHYKTANITPITTKPNPVKECVKKREEIITTNVMVTVDSITSQDT